MEDEAFLINYQSTLTTKLGGFEISLNNKKVFKGHPNRSVY